MRSGIDVAMMGGERYYYETRNIQRRCLANCERNEDVEGVGDCVV
jgi:hypothetical protein